ncbi:Uncharacterised protein [Salmonella enterica subsp. enterica serovar Typhi]|nr:Uncharacterised protein [Salmonella enterica subsp. enterica serovar Typhi]
MPGRRHKNVFCGKMKSFVADSDLPCPFNDVVDSAVGAPRHTRGKAFWQQLQERAHRRHRITASDGINVTQLVAFPLIRIAHTGQIVQRLATAVVTVVENRRRVPALVAQRQHIRCIARQIIALFSRHRLLIFGIVFRKTTAQEID